MDRRSSSARAPAGRPPQPAARCHPEERSDEGSQPVNHTRLATTKAACTARAAPTANFATGYSIRCMAEICALPDYGCAGETRDNRESLLQNTKGWARLFASSPAFFCLPGPHACSPSPRSPKEIHMLKPFSATLVLFCVVGLTSCSSTPKSPAVADQIRHALDQSGYKDVSVSQDRDKGVVTLTGHVPADADKSTAENIARGLAGAQVISDQISVLPPGNESATKEVNKDLDEGIEKNLAAVYIQDSFNSDVKYELKNGVVTLTGTVSAQTRRAAAERIATGVPNVVQVVNELEVKGQKATSTSVR